MCGGPLRCGLLSVQVSPADDGNTTSVLRRLSGVGLPVSHLYAAAANGRKGSLYVVPNVVHFIWFADNATKPLTFINYVSVVSAHRIQRPDSIWLHISTSQNKSSPTVASPVVRRRTPLLSESARRRPPPGARRRRGHGRRL